MKICFSQKCYSTEVIVCIVCILTNGSNFTLVCGQKVYKKDCYRHLLPVATILLWAIHVILPNFAQTTVNRLKMGKDQSFWFLF